MARPCKLISYLLLETPIPYQLLFLQEFFIFSPDYNAICSFADAASIAIQMAKTLLNGLHSAMPIQWLCTLVKHLLLDLCQAPPLFKYGMPI